MNDASGAATSSPSAPAPGRPSSRPATPGRALQQVVARARGSLGQRGLEQLAHHAEGEVALELAAARAQRPRRPPRRTPRAPRRSAPTCRCPPGPRPRAGCRGPSCARATAASMRASSASRSRTSALPPAAPLTYTTAIAPGSPSTRRPTTAPGSSPARAGSTATSRPPEVVASHTSRARHGATPAAKVREAVGVLAVAAGCRPTAARSSSSSASTPSSAGTAAASTSRREAALAREPVQVAEQAEARDVGHGRRAAPATAAAPRRR